jgi:hypothetical protein
MSYCHPSAARGRDDESWPWCLGSLTTFEYPKTELRGNAVKPKFAEITSTRSGGH